MLAIFKREFMSYFITPIGYIFVAVFLIVSGAIFSVVTLQSPTAISIESYFMFLIFIFIIIIPLLTMRSLSEERKMKTEQLLLTAPVSLAGMIFGKFLAAYALFTATLGVSCLNFIILYMYGEPNTAIILGNIISILLVGAAFISIGLFISATTENQLTSAVLSIGATCFLLFTGVFASVVNVTWVRYFLYFISIFTRYENFANGIFDFNSLIYYISFVIVFLFLTIRLYEARRWQ